MPPMSESEMVVFITLMGFLIWFALMFIGVGLGEFFARRKTVR
jgi:hypothetical protein